MKLNGENTLKAILKKIKQKFCRHKSCDWYLKREKFSCLSGDRHYYICNDCGKIIKSIFVRHD
jgi:hypothetical protein